ncbi:MAG: ABC transporter substrate-binding protein, partial [Nocardioidaceae bacterium]
MDPRRARLLLPAALLGLALSACAAPSAPAGSTTENRSWSRITDQAKGQTVDLWMYGGDQQGNAYVDDVL